MPMDSKPMVFMILPFREELLHLYEELKSQFSEHYDFKNAGDLDNQQNILKDIITGISQASVVIADLTGLNSNVFYELGLAHAMNKKVIIISQDLDEIPFDIKSYRVVGYSLLFYKISELMDELEKLIAGALDGSVKYGNPVSDFLPHYFQPALEAEKPAPLQPENQEDHSNDDSHVSADAEDGEKGFLDYVLEVKENGEIMVSELNDMKDHMEDMNSSIISAQKEISRVKANGGNADMSFVRNVCRKLAAPMEFFSERLKVHVKNIGDSWLKVEDSYLALLENPYAVSPKNRENLTESLKSVQDLKNAVAFSDEKVKLLSDSLQGNIGMERRLNKAITNLINELNAYLTMTSTMAASIDRIVSKGNVVLNT